MNLYAVYCLPALTLRKETRRLPAAGRRVRGRSSQQIVRAPVVYPLSRRVATPLGIADFSLSMTCTA